MRRVPADPRARIIVVPALTPGVDAMTLDRWIFVRRGHEQDERLLTHELVHVRQWRERGVVRFLREYLGAYLAGHRRGLSHREAYLAIPLEQEARAAELSYAPTA
jgi:Domain of unknown function (DUF4157)